ncbi:Complex I intermediate-associated protein 30, mitochondrial [Nowakowskiella sp. JEL0078]|nr:Complex I intermediate-associated protein 30, mitochondrial [Nowakowskiella sp. JEL0078]
MPDTPVRALAAYVKRSAEAVKRGTLAAIRMDHGWKQEMSMFDFHSKEHLEQWVVGSDADIGGYSEAYWGLTQQNNAMLWGTLSTEIPSNSKIERSGYAGIRSKELPLTLLHRPRFDTSRFRYLAIRARGDTKQCSPGEWETIVVPFRDFILTAHGYVQTHKMDMDRSKVKTVGFSVVRQPGDFSLELDWVKAVNTSSTFGDLDILEAGTYMDSRQQLRRLKPGQTLEEVLNTRIRFFEDPMDKMRDDHEAKMKSKEKQELLLSPDENLKSKNKI